MIKKRLFLTTVAASLAWRLLRRSPRKGSSTQAITTTRQIARRAPHAQRPSGSAPLSIARLLGFIAIGLRSRGGRVSVVVFGGVFMQSAYVAGPVDIGPQGRGRSAAALTDGQSR